MALLFARVQLTGDPAREAYERLHARMAQIGFQVQITTSSGTWELPHATCAGTGYVTAGQASNAAKEAADSVVANSLVFITSGSDWQANGLTKIQ